MKFASRDQFLAYLFRMIRSRAEKSTDPEIRKLVQFCDEGLRMVDEPPPVVPPKINRRQSQNRA